MTRTIRGALSALAGVSVVAIGPIPVAGAPVEPRVVAATAPVDLGDYSEGHRAEPRSVEDGTTPESARRLAARLASRYGWTGDELACLDRLWQEESGWDYRVVGPTDDYGIPQAHAPAHPETRSASWRSSPARQIRWGLDYIEGRYGSPCSAWAEWTRRGEERGTGRGWY